MSSPESKRATRVAAVRSLTTKGREGGRVLKGETKKNWSKFEVLGRKRIKIDGPLLQDETKIKWTRNGRLREINKM